MRFLYWTAVAGALLLSGASAWFFFGDLSKDERHQAVDIFDQRVGELAPAAKAGRSGAQYRLGRVYAGAVDGLRDAALARYWFRKAAEQGHIAAQYELGMMYARGDGVPQSYYRAAEWLRLAAGLGRHRDAQFALGEMYFYGRGVAPDYGQAQSWYRKAAERGHPVAQYLLGVMYMEGWGVETDDLEAYKWLTLAAPKGKEILAHDENLDVRVARDKLLARMNRSQLEQARKLVAEWKPEP